MERFLLRVSYWEFVVKILKEKHSMIQINQSFYKQVHYCAMGDPLSVISADMLMVWTDNEHSL